MAWAIDSAYHDKPHGLIVVWVSKDGAPPRQFTWSDQDPRLYNAQGQLRTKRVIIDGMKADIKAQLLAEQTPPPAPDLEAYPGAGETL